MKFGLMLRFIPILSNHKRIEETVMGIIRILRITNSGGPTSSPLNTFTIARSLLYRDEETTYLSYSGNFDGSKYVNAYSSLTDEDKGRIIFKNAGNRISQFYRAVFDWHKINSKLGTAAIVHIHKPKRGFLFAPLRLIFRIGPFVYTVHNNYENYSKKDKVFLAASFWSADHITFVSRDAYKSFEDKTIRPNKKKTSVIQNGVDVERIDKETSGQDGVREDRDSFRMIAIGRYVPQKNYAFLLEIMKQLDSSYHLDIYGTGSKSAELIEQVSNLGLKNKVSVYGNVPRAELYKALVKRDAFVSTSQWEGLPVAMMEAMGCGLPVVATAIDSHKEVGDNSEGVSLHDESVLSWITALHKIKTMSAENRQRLGLQNKKTIKDHFSLTRMQEDYRNLYERLSGIS